MKLVVTVLIEASLAYVPDARAIEDIEYRFVAQPNPFRSVP